MYLYWNYNIPFEVKLQTVISNFCCLGYAATLYRTSKEILSRLCWKEEFRESRNSWITSVQAMLILIRPRWWELYFLITVLLVTPVTWWLCKSFLIQVLSHNLQIKQSVLHFMSSLCLSNYKCPDFYCKKKFKKNGVKILNRTQCNKVSLICNFIFEFLAC